MRVFLHDPDRKLLIVSRDRVREFSDVPAAWEAAGPLLEDHGNRAALRELTAGTTHDQRRWDDHDVRDVFADRLVHGDLVIVDYTEERVRVGRNQRQQTPTPLEVERAAKANRQEPETEHFIEIELLDDDDQPVAGEAYFIELPDGSTKSGTLDAEGKARVDGVDPGSARVSFPGLDQKRYQSS